jgi:transcription termination factor Rho
MLPPSADDSKPSSARADSDESKKKSRLIRTRGRPAKAEKVEKAEKTEKPAKARGRRGAKAEASPEVSVREAAAVVVPAPAPVPEPPRVVSAPVWRDEPAAVSPPAPEPAPAPAAEDRGGSQPDAKEPPAAGHEPQAPEQSTPAQGGGSGGQGGADGGDQRGGGRPDWQGGHHGDRGFWKHGRRKRGRHGGPWQPGPHGGGREQLPPQLPPPSNVPVFGDLPNPTRFNDLAALDALAADLAGGKGETVFLDELYALNLADLGARARKLGVGVEGAAPRRQILPELFKLVAERKHPLRDRGYIDQNDRGHFIVHTHCNYRLYPEDAYLPDSLVKRYGLKRGHRVEVLLQTPLEGERCPSAVRVESVMGLQPESIAAVTPFEELVPYYPLKRILLEDSEVVKDMSMRAVDILAPIGFGQRGLIVAPPRTGKTILLQNIANSITANSPDVKLILLLIDERPEEVTDFRRHTKGEVVSSTFDETPESHVHCAEMVIEICRRRVEQGEHVVVLLDSITRLARAYNALAGSGGKTMSGGLESNALQKPKRFFGSARNIEGGGSLTIIASALIDTGSRMDEIIFEEFKGTGNCEVHLDRGLVERRIFPAINIDRSGTRKEELIYHPDELQRIYGLRRAMQGLGPIESMEMLITRLRKTKSNTEFLLSLAPK